MRMKFLMTYTAATAAPPSPEKLAALGQLTVEMIKSGVVLMTGGLQRPAKGTHVRFANGELRITDGPFAETKELIDGFALIQCASREEALAHCERFMRVAGEGDGEILQVFEGGEIPHR
jgi:hypothetical protein